MLIIILDIIALLSAITALVLLAVRWKRITGFDIRTLLLLLFTVTIIYFSFLLIEWMGISHSLEQYEDFMGALIPMLWAFVFYAFIQRGITRDLIKSEENIRVGTYLKTHELNDTLYSFELYHRTGSSSVLLDSETVPPGDEMFITNASFYLDPGMVKDTLYINVRVYNRLYARSPGALSVSAKGSLQLIPVEVENNGTVEANSYWDAPTMRMEVPKNPGTYDVKLEYNGEERDLAQVNT